MPNFLFAAVPGFMDVVAQENKRNAAKNDETYKNECIDWEEEKERFNANELFINAANILKREHDKMKLYGLNPNKEQKMFNS